MPSDQNRSTGLWLNSKKCCLGKYLRLTNIYRMSCQAISKFCQPSSKRGQNEIRGNKRDLKKKRNLLRVANALKDNFQNFGRSFFLNLRPPKPKQKARNLRQMAEGQSFLPSLVFSHMPHYQINQIKEWFWSVPSNIQCFKQKFQKLKMKIGCRNRSCGLWTGCICNTHY